MGSLSEESEFEKAAVYFVVHKNPQSFVLLRIPENMPRKLKGGQMNPVPCAANTPYSLRGRKGGKIYRRHKTKTAIIRTGVSLREVSGCARTRVQTILGF